jgi:hypothetical protein
MEWELPLFSNIFPREVEPEVPMSGIQNQDKEF